MRPMAQREMMEPGSVASDKSLCGGERSSGLLGAARATCAAGGRTVALCGTSQSCAAWTPCCSGQAPWRGSVGGVSSSLWVSRRRQTCSRPQGRAAGSRHSGMGVHPPGRLRSGGAGDLLLGLHVTAASTSERLDNTRARQPCRRPGVSAQRRRRLDRCVAAGPFAALMTFCRAPCPDARARLSQCSQPQSAGRTAPRRPGKQSVRGARVSRTVAAGAAATPPVTLGSKIPDVELSYFDSEHQLQRLSTKDLCSGKKARRLTVPGCCWPPFRRLATVEAHTSPRTVCAGGAVCGAWRVHADLQVRMSTRGWPWGETLYCRPCTAP